VGSSSSSLTGIQLSLLRTTERLLNVIKGGKHLLTFFFGKCVRIVRVDTVTASHLHSCISFVLSCSPCLFSFVLIMSSGICAAALGSVVGAQPRAVIVSHVRQRGAQPRLVLF